MSWFDDLWHWIFPEPVATGPVEKPKTKPHPVQRTKKGRVVYNRPLHEFSAADVLRVLLAFSDRNLISAIHNLFGIGGELIARALLHARRDLAVYALTIASAVWTNILRPLVEQGLLDLKTFVTLIGYVPPPPPTGPTPV